MRLIGDQLSVCSVRTDAGLSCRGCRYDELCSPEIKMSLRGGDKVPDRGQYRLNNIKKERSRDDGY